MRHIEKTIDSTTTRRLYRISAFNSRISHGHKRCHMQIQSSFPGNHGIVRFLAAHGLNPRLFIDTLIPTHHPSASPPATRHPSPVSRVSRSPDPIRLRAKPQSPQRLLAAYKYPVCLAACTCAPCAIRFVTNARPKGPAAGNTASNQQPNQTINQTKQSTQPNQPSARPARGACDTT